MPSLPKHHQPYLSSTVEHAHIVVSDDLSPKGWQRLWHRLSRFRRLVRWATRSALNMSIVIVSVGLVAYFGEVQIKKLVALYSFQDTPLPSNVIPALTEATPGAAGSDGNTMPNHSSTTSPGTTGNNTSSSATAPSTSANNTTVTNGVDVGTYGAAGNGTTDDTAALNKAFSHAPAGTTLVLGAGKTYKHSGLLKVTVPGLRITGPGTLLATNQLNSALQINADNVTIDGGLYFKFDTAGATRQSAGWETMIYVQGSSGTHVSNITIDGSPSAGILFSGASNYVVDTVLVENTLADSIHSTNGSYNGLIKNSTSINSSDDGFANVSYASNTTQVHDITYENDTVKNQLAGRGFSVVGGHDITFNNIYYAGGTTSSAAIYVASEANFKTYGVANVHVHGAVINRANTTTSYRAVLIYDSQPAYAITDIDISDVTITNTGADAPGVVGMKLLAGTGILRVGLYRFTITGSQSPLAVSGTSPMSYSTVGWTVNNTPVADHIGF